MNQKDKDFIKKLNKTLEELRLDMTISTCQVEISEDENGGIKIIRLEPSFNNLH